MCLSSFAYCWTFVSRILTKVRFSIWWYLTGFSCSNAVEHTKHQPIAEVSCFKSQWVLSLYFFHKTQIYSQICVCRCTAKKKRHSDQLQTLKSNNVFLFFISMTCTEKMFFCYHGSFWRISQICSRWKFLTSIITSTKYLTLEGDLTIHKLSHLWTSTWADHSKALGISRAAKGKAWFSRHAVETPVLCRRDQSCVQLWHSVAAL